MKSTSKRGMERDGKRTAGKAGGKSEQRDDGTRLPEKGPTTGSIIGAIIGVILLLAIIGTAIAMYRKHHNNKLNGDGPPKYKPPPPTKKTNTSTDRLNVAHNPVSEGRPLQSEDYAANQSAEPVTDLDNYTQENDDGYGPEDEREHYYSAAPAGWDDPAHSEILPPYAAEGPQEDDPRGTSVNREDSFVSPAMYV